MVRARGRPGLRLIHEDARPFLRGTDRRYDAIFVDAYRQPYIPFYLTTDEFFDLVRERLNPGGTVIVNAGHPEGSASSRRCWRRACAPSSAPRRLRHHGGLHAAGRRRPGAVGTRVRRQMAAVHAEVRSLFARTARGLRPPLVGEKAFTDDRAPVEWLIDRSLVTYAADADSGRAKRSSKRPKQPAKPVAEDRLNLPGALDEHRDPVAA